MTMTDPPLDFKYKEHIKPDRIYEGYCRVCRRWTSTDEGGMFRPHGPGVEALMCVGAGEIAIEQRSMYPKPQPTNH